MAFSAYEVSPVAIDGAPISADLISRYRTNAMFLDMVSRWARPTPWTDQVYLLDGYGGSPSPLGGASFQFRSGMTTLSAVIYSRYTSGTHTFRWYLNGTLISTQSLTGGSGGGTQTFNATITGYGLADGDVPDIQMEVVWTGAVGSYRVIDLYATNVNAIAAIPTFTTPPTFGAITAANLNQLAAAQEYAMGRVEVMAFPFFMGHLFYPGHAFESTKLLWHGSTARTNGANRLRVALGFYIQSNVQEQFRVTIFSTESTYLSPIFSSNNVAYQTYLFDIDISAQTDGVPFAMALEQIVIEEGTVNVGGRNRQLGSRYICFHIRTEVASPSAPTVPAETTPMESMTYATLQSRLNSIATLTNTAISRLTGAFDSWNRQRLFRWVPAADDGQRQAMRNVLVGKFYRWGDRLVVKGSNVRLAYDHLHVNKNLDEEWTYTFRYEETLTDGDEIQVQEVNLNTLPGLYPGMDVWILADDIRYAAMHVR